MLSGVLCLHLIISWSARQLPTSRVSCALRLPRSCLLLPEKGGKMRHVQNRFPYPLKCLPRGQDRIIRQRGKSQAHPLGYVNCFTNVIFRPVKRLKLIENLFSEKSAKLYSGFSRGNSTVVITIYFCIVCFEAVVRELGDISNNRLKCAGFQE